MKISKKWLQRNAHEWRRCIQCLVDETNIPHSKRNGTIPPVIGLYIYIHYINIYIYIHIYIVYIYYIYIYINIYEYVYIYILYIYTYTYIYIWMTYRNMYLALLFTQYLSRPPPDVPPKNSRNGTHLQDAASREALSDNVSSWSVRYGEYEKIYTCTHTCSYIV